MDTLRYFDFGSNLEIAGASCAVRGITSSGGVALFRNSLYLVSSSNAIAKVFFFSIQNVSAQICLGFSFVYNRKVPAGSKKVISR